MLRTFSICAIALLFLGGRVRPADYFVSTQGDDGNGGLSRTAAFRTVQKGVDTLKPGDTLTVMPGEYGQNVRRKQIGSQDQDTVIRAQIPGTVTLRGDVPAPAFREVKGQDYVYVADFDAADHVSAVNELDTLTILDAVPNASELAYVPGAFHYDKKAAKLYLSSSDWRPPSEHRYTVSVIPTHGFYLYDAHRVIIEGLTVTGFYADHEMPRHDYTLNGTWGLFLAGAKNCVICNCRAYLNAQGIGVNSLARPGYRPGEYGGNVIETCVAWGNGSPLGVGDRGGITLVQTRRDLVRNSRSFLNADYGINIRSGNREHTEEDKSRLVGNIAWGNGKADVKIKTGFDNIYATERTVAMHPSNDYDPSYCLLEDADPNKIPASNIVLQAEKDLDLDVEFADPENRDYRLQATSRFRGDQPGGDKGPYAYKENIFYVGPRGDDKADGLSVANAWRTLGRAVRDLKPGDTVYMEPGEYRGKLELRAEGDEGRPVAMRGRGKGPVTIVRGVRVTEARHIEFKRLNFQGGVYLRDAEAVAFSNCRFLGEDTGLQAAKTAGLAVWHCEFSDFGQAGIALTGCSGVDLRGNLYDNRNGVGVRTDAFEAVLYSAYNAYRNTTAAWQVDGRILSVGHAGHDTHVRDMEGLVALKTGGPLGRPVGPYRDEQPQKEMRLVQAPVVHSTSATTANVEWRTSLPSVCGVAWGDTPECKNRESFLVDCFASCSLTGLKPGATYCVRLTSLQVPREMADKIKAERVELEAEPVSFTTLASRPAPRTLYVAADGDDGNRGLDRANAWRTIQHAADNVRPGDTVRIAGGTYTERVRIRATGAAGAPITFACMPGEKVRLSGAGKKLNRAFIAGGKSHLRFDGFYFKDFSREPLHVSNWPVRLAGNFQLYRCHDIKVSRCFADGRGGYSARFISALQVDHLAIENCVMMNKMSGSMVLRQCPTLRMEHTVICRPMITCFYLLNEAKHSAVMNHNIFTDMLAKKAKHNIYLFYGRCPQMRNNCYFLRQFPPEERHLFGKSTAADLKEHIHDPVFADPKFPGDPSPDTEGFPPDRLMQTSLDLDFSSFFATNPEVVKRGIGLQPAAFRDFGF